jgi:hypothetical protein
MKPLHASEQRFRLQGVFKNKGPQIQQDDLGMGHPHWNLF